MNAHSYEWIRATAAACVMATSAHGQYALFDDPYDTISIPGGTVAATTMTIEARIWLFASVNGLLIYNEQRAAAEDKWLAATPTAASGGAWTSVQYESSGWPGYAGEICPRRWHHLAFVRDGNDQRLYLDGALVATKPWTELIGNSSQSTRAVGAFLHSAGLRTSMHGLIDFVRISDSVRYVGDSFVPPLESDLVSDPNTQLLFSFNESPGSATVVDSGPGGFVGTLGVGLPGATSPELTSVVPSSADFNGDGSVDGDDLGTLLGLWGSDACICDFDRNGIVDGSDLGFLLGEWTG